MLPASRASDWRACRWDDGSLADAGVSRAAGTSAMWSLPGPSVLRIDYQHTARCAATRVSIARADERHIVLSPSYSTDRARF